LCTPSIDLLDPDPLFHLFKLDSQQWFDQNVS
jgi:hypothetical protein